MSGDLQVRGEGLCLPFFGTAGGHGEDGARHAGPAASDAGLRPGLSEGQAEPGSRGLLRSGAQGRRPAHLSRRGAHGARLPPLPPLYRGHGGRVSGRQPRAGRDLRRHLRPGKQALSRRRHQAVHLPLPPRRSRDLPGEIRGVRKAGFRRGADPAAGELPLPARDPRRGQRRLLPLHVRDPRRRGL